MLAEGGNASMPSWRRRSPRSWSSRTTAASAATATCPHVSAAGGSDSSPSTTARARRPRPGRHVRAGRRLRGGHSTGRRWPDGATRSARWRRPCPAPSPDCAPRTSRPGGCRSRRCSSPRSSWPTPASRSTGTSRLRSSRAPRRDPRDPAAAAHLLATATRPRGPATSAPPAGSTPPPLAATLRADRARGPAGFHGGPAARAIEAEVAAAAASSPPRTSPATRPSLARVADELPRTCCRHRQRPGRLRRVQPARPVPCPASRRAAPSSAPARRGLRPRLRRQRRVVRRRRTRRQPARRAAQPGVCRRARADDPARPGARPGRSPPPTRRRGDPGSGGPRHDPGDRGRRPTAMAAALITTIGHDFGGLVYVPEVGLFPEQLDGRTSTPAPAGSTRIAPGRMPLFAVPSDRGGRTAARCSPRRLRRLPHPERVVHAFVHVSTTG